MSGWIRLWRSLLNHPLWTRERFTLGQAWIDLLLSAAHTDHPVPRGTQMVLERRGDFLTSQVALAARWRWDRETVRRFFRALERGNMCRIRTSKESETGYTLVSIMNYERYQGDVEQSSSLSPASDAPSVAPSNPASVPHPCPTPKKGKKGKKQKEPSPAFGLTLEKYLTEFPPEGQEVLHQAIQAIASTRKSGKVAQSVLDAQARKWSRFPPEIVVKACRVYLDRGYANEGKAEAYLLGIIRQEAKRAGNGREASSSFVGQKGWVSTPATPADTPAGQPYPNPTTEGQRAINRAWLDQQRDQERAR